MTIDINTAVRFVDDFLDQDPRTRDSSPGKVHGHRLVLIGKQRERRFFKKFSHPIKNYIFLEEGTENIWYKQSFNNAGVVKMGFSLSELGMDKKSVPMETYYKYFVANKGLTSSQEWLQRNDFELI